MSSSYSPTVTVFKQMSTTNASDFTSVAYDYLILGGGVGGLTLATR